MLHEQTLQANLSQERDRSREKAVLEASREVLFAWTARRESRHPEISPVENPPELPQSQQGPPRTFELL